MSGASPVVVRCIVTRNRASAQGSGIHIEGGSRALIFNNLVTHNRRDGPGDPHGIEVVGAAPSIVNNSLLFSSFTTRVASPRTSSNSNKI